MLKQEYLNNKEIINDGLEDLTNYINLLCNLYEYYHFDKYHPTNNKISYYKNFLNINSNIHKEYYFYDNTNIYNYDKDFTLKIKYITYTYTLNGCNDKNDNVVSDSGNLFLNNINVKNIIKKIECTVNNNYSYANYESIIKFISDKNNSGEHFNNLSKIYLHLEFNYSILKHAPYYMISNNEYDLNVSYKIKDEELEEIKNYFNKNNLHITKIINDDIIKINSNNNNKSLYPRLKIFVEENNDLINKNQINNKDNIYEDIYYKSSTNNLYFFDIKQDEKFYKISNKIIIDNIKEIINLYYNIYKSLLKNNNFKFKIQEQDIYDFIKCYIDIINNYKITYNLNNIYKLKDNDEKLLNYKFYDLKEIYNIINNNQLLLITLYLNNYEDIDDVINEINNNIELIKKRIKY